jgi:hypothetical protein
MGVAVSGGPTREMGRRIRRPRQSSVNGPPPEKGFLSRVRMVRAGERDTDQAPGQRRLAGAHDTTLGRTADACGGR